MDRAEILQKFERAEREIRKVFLGEDDLVRCFFICFASAGISENPHMLLTGDTGTGKTKLTKSLAQVFGLEKRRISGHSELLPSDIIGETDILAPGRPFIRGPVFTNLLQSDEHNRIPPKSRAALLEGMAEGQVTVVGIAEPMALPKPFIVIATQNPASYGDSAPLRPQENDRFLLSYFMQWQEEEIREAVLRHFADFDEGTMLDQVFLPGELLKVSQNVKHVFVSQVIRKYIVVLTSMLNSKHSTLLRVQDRKMVNDFPPIRPMQDTLTAARALAFLLGKNEVGITEVDWVVPFSLPHRIETAGREELTSGEIHELMDDIRKEAKKIMRLA